MADGLPPSGASSVPTDKDMEAKAQKRLEFGGSEGDQNLVPCDPDLEVYNLLGEEIPVEKGMVQKQKQGQNQV